MRKVLLVLILMFSGSVFADNIYCPQILLCKNKKCTALDHNGDFYISNEWGRLSNVVLFFNRAIFIQIMGESTCEYRTKDEKSGVVLTFKYPVKANITYPENNWFDTANGRWGGVYYCQYNSLNCPFKFY